MSSDAQLSLPQSNVWTDDARRHPLALQGLFAANEICRSGEHVRRTSLVVTMDHGACWFGLMSCLNGGARWQA